MGFGILYCLKCKSFNIGFIEERINDEDIWLRCEECKHEFKIPVE